MTMVPILDGRFLYADKTLTFDDPANEESPTREVTLRFQAENVRKERTGIHAKIHIMINDKPIAWDQFNVERHGERQKLVNFAHKTFGPVGPIGYANNLMLNDFGQFCDQLWDASLTMIRAEEMAGDPDIPQRFHLFPYVLEGAGTILYAPGGRGKSITCLLMAVAIDSGIDTFWPIEIGKTMYINLERSRSSMQRRLGMINRVLGLDERRSLLMFNGRGRSLDEIGDHLVAEIADRDVEVIILDSISRTGLGKLNADEVANKIADTLNALSSTWLAIAHTPRSDESHIFGSTHFENAADMTVRMHSAQEELKLGVGLEITKANDVGRQPMSVVGYEFGNEREGLIRAWPANENEFPELVTERRRSLAEDIVTYFKNESPTATSAELSKALARHRSQVSTILANDNRFVVVRTGNRGVKFYGLSVHPHEAEMMDEV